MLNALATRDLCLPGHLVSVCVCWCFFIFGVFFVNFAEFSILHTCSTKFEDGALTPIFIILQVLARKRRCFGLNV